VAVLEELAGGAEEGVPRGTRARPGDGFVKRLLDQPVPLDELGGRLTDEDVRVMSAAPRFAILRPEVDDDRLAGRDRA
jgi:hypothetical protein